MIEAPVTLIDDNGAPRGEKYFVFYTPPVVNAAPGHPPLLRQRVAGASPLIFLKNGLQTIVFARSRLTTEVLLTYLKEDIETTIRTRASSAATAAATCPLKRREIEKGLRERRDPRRRLDQRPRARASTSAPWTWPCWPAIPGTIATHLAAGRAGRAARRAPRPRSWSPRARPLDQFIVNNPDYFFSASPPRRPSSTPTTSPSSSATSSAPPSSCPFEDGETLRPGEISRDPQVPRGGEAPPPLQGQVVLDVGRLPGRRGQPAERQLGQFRRRRHDRAEPGSSPRSTSPRP